MVLNRTGLFAAAVALVLAANAGCANHSLRAVEQAASAGGFERILLPGTGDDVPGGEALAHVAWVSAAARSARPQVLHVYIEGDGRPWQSRARIAADPTPAMPLMFELMLLDPAPAVYLGRPCYFGQARSPPCEPRLWTSARYGATVRNSMHEALTSLARQYQWPADDRPRLRLFGHSGGGVIAMLLASRVARADAGFQVTDLVTLGANLDLEAWTLHHGYAPLFDSLDPALQPAVPASVMQWHFSGLEDTQVPPYVTRRGLRQQPRAHFEVLPGFDHHCCWKPLWRELLAKW